MSDSPEHIYRGEAASCIVTVDGQRLPWCYGQTRDGVMHSPTGFAWGYGGSGPAQLAFAILHYELGAIIAHKFYQDFKWDVIAALDTQQDFIISSTRIREFIDRCMDELT